MFSNISVDMILSDPMLLTGAALFILGPLGFLFCLVKYFSAKNDAKQEFVVPTDPEEQIPDREPFTPAPPAEPEQQSIPEPQTEPEPQIQQVEPQPAESEPTPEPVTSAPSEPAPAPAAVESAADKTVVIPPAVNELQGQVEIAFSQIRELNSKANDLEQQVETLQNQKGTQLEPNQLKEGPSNAADFSQKLLKLAEHVIILEKEVARIKGLLANNQKEKEPEASDAQKPPIMPL